MLETIIKTILFRPQVRSGKNRSICWDENKDVGRSPKICGMMPSPTPNPKYKVNSLFVTSYLVLSFDQCCGSGSVFLGHPDPDSYSTKNRHIIYIFLNV